MLATAVAVAAAAAAAADQPSFLFILGDDIGWGDFGYNNGTAKTPFVDAWAKRDGTIVMQDGHSGGTVCSPTRATVLTGRNHFRDCVNGVYGCSDMTECDPHFPFAQQRTFTFPDAARAAGKGYKSWFGGKWHLGSFFNDSEVPSSPIFHGFDHMNATVEVAPTATTNCQCRQDWDKTCDFGHYKKPTHCSGGRNPGGGDLPNGCCFNYWWEADAPHGITNLTNQVSDDDSAYLAEAFLGFLASRNGEPFAAQVSFHNCHIPYIGMDSVRAQCKSGDACQPTNGRGDVAANYTDAQLDFYSCMRELDASIGKVLNGLDSAGYYDNTFVWFTTDNGPEGNCGPEGFCEHQHYWDWPGDAGLLRGRKRDIWEGGHRVPTIVSWPAVVKGPARVSWDLVVTMDFLATIMEVLSVERPAKQQNWAFDGKSIMPILRGEQWPDRGVGWAFDGWSESDNHGYRFGKWKYVDGTKSCTEKACQREFLYDLSVDLSERNDVSAQHPDVLAAIRSNYSTWYASVSKSRETESLCDQKPTPAPAPPSSDCQWTNDTGLSGGDLTTGTVATKEECCGMCRATPGCKGADFNAKKVYDSVPASSGVFSREDLQPFVGHTCHLKRDYKPVTRKDGSVACKPN
eukprot:TRINITY_DN6879_c0_g2_i4.p1 TRINITY_DN6879_c0_g2~~TRINITY_DN6879_c0_g2_i4.p1  ORF type:complete len:629 (+),score=238.06 TRINITY_DN6879_c0_g2_i4:52-1938(+)